MCRIPAIPSHQSRLILGDVLTTSNDSLATFQYVLTDVVWKDSRVFYKLFHQTITTLIPAEHRIGLC
jgi:hypothetical protein